MHQTKHVKNLITNMIKECSLLNNFSKKSNLLNNFTNSPPEKNDGK